MPKITVTANFDNFTPELKAPIPCPVEGQRHIPGVAGLVDGCLANYTVYDATKPVFTRARRLKNLTAERH